MNKLLRHSFIAIQWVQLFLLKVYTSCLSLVDDVKIAYRYYGCTLFRRADLSLKFKYLWKNPYKIHRQYRETHGSPFPYSYGETPLSTFVEMMQHALANPSDRYVELGCGRGRNCFWMRTYLGCEVLGIEDVPTFVEKAVEICHLVELRNITFQCADFLTASSSIHGGGGSWLLEEATLVYVDATLIEGKELSQLKKLCRCFRKGTRIVTIHLDLEKEWEWRRIDEWNSSFFWGTTKASLFRREK